MRKSTIIKSMLLLCALIVGSSSVWAEEKPWSGDDPESTLDLKTITSSTMGTWNSVKSWYLDEDYLVVSGYESYKSVANQTWITQANVGSSNTTWEASDPFKGSSYYTNAYYATIQSGRYLLYKVTNMKSLKVYGKNNATTKYLDIFIYTKSGDDYTKVEEIKYTADKNVHIWENSEILDPDETYYIYITGVGGSNSQVYEVAFERNSVVDNREAAGLAYTVENQTVTVGNVLAAPELTNPNGLTVSYISGDETIATVDEEGNVTGVSKGITTITASFEGNSTYKPGSASYTIIVTKVMASNSIMYESFDLNDQKGGNDGIWKDINITPNPVFDLEGWDYETAYGASKCVRIGKNGYFLSPVLGATGNVTLMFKAESWGTDGSNAWVDIVDGGTFDDSETLTGVTILTVEEAKTRAQVALAKTGTWTEYTLKINGVTPSSKIRFWGPNNKRIFFDEVEVFCDLTATVTSAGWATWVAPFKVTVPSGVEAYAVALNGTKTELTALTAIPGGTPVLLKNAGTYEFPVATETPAAVTTALLVSDGTITSADNAFVLANKEQGVGFYRWIGNSDSPAIPAGKVYLVYTGTSAPDFIDFGDATGIRMVNDSGFMVNGSETYNLNGQRVAQPTKGLYIVNGKKVIIK